MLCHRRGLTAVGILLLAMAAAPAGQDEMVANPFYKFWAGSKPGARAVHVESTKLSGPEGKAVPDGVDEKRITYKLVELTKDRAVVEMVVTEKDFLGYVQAAPTRYIYPAKLKKSRVERIFQDAGKSGEETVKVAGKGIKCKTVQGHVKGPNGEQIEYKVWLSNTVPGNIVKQVRTARQKEETIAETTTTLQSFKAAK
jgi:hypothetical protein